MASMDLRSSCGPQCILPVAAADGPGTEPNGSKVQVGVAELASGADCLWVGDNGGCVAHKIFGCRWDLACFMRSIEAGRE